jgi:hypothetical protein
MTNGCLGRVRQAERLLQIQLLLLRNAVKETASRGVLVFEGCEADVSEDASYVALMGDMGEGAGSAIAPKHPRWQVAEACL